MRINPTTSHPRVFTLEKKKHLGQIIGLVLDVTSLLTKMHNIYYALILIVNGRDTANQQMNVTHEVQQ